jgi:hypothetical protein
MQMPLREMEVNSRILKPLMAHQRATAAPMPYNRLLREVPAGWGTERNVTGQVYERPTSAR